MKGLKGKVAIVTGGGRGIGKATCKTLVEYGVNVAIAEINDETGQQVESDLRAQGGDVCFIKTDIAQEESIAAMVARTVEQFGRVDILINNAVLFVPQGIEATAAEWETALRVNVIGYALCIKHCVAKMKAVGKGAIVNVSSNLAFVAQPDCLLYSTAKSALTCMTKSMAMELAPFHIRVNAVCPGTTWTELCEKYYWETMGLTRETADQHPQIGGAQLLKRVAEPIEIAEAIAFLASDSASFITAENLMVDGGYTAL
ncbi:SDR family NAD(P)-dependent oxidoreductase [Leptolyngbya sp. AN02str]|uniref:SDR family NAD(P)-dependent oxidoreductase n=1 Tax=Leptolyngbya sp. AN02str TaxID=3423363 RepID=UPI003D316DD9